MTWQPIATAPKSALYPPKIDLWVEGGNGGYRVADALWHNGAWVVKRRFVITIKVRAFPAGHAATHWMRRPLPPSVQPEMDD